MQSDKDIKVTGGVYKEWSGMNDCDQPSVLVYKIMKVRKRLRECLTNATVMKHSFPQAPKVEKMNNLCFVIKLKRYFYIFFLS